MVLTDDDAKAASVQVLLHVPFNDQHRAIIFAPVLDPTKLVMEIPVSRPVTPHGLPLRLLSIFRLQLIVTDASIPLQFGRRRRNNSKFDFLSLERVLSGLQLKDQLSFDDEDTWGPFGLATIHSPSEPLLEFIFIHGLGGGSRKTWSFSSKLHHFWPKEWLSKDPAF